MLFSSIHWTIYYIIFLVIISLYLQQLDKNEMSNTVSENQSSNNQNNSSNEDLKQQDGLTSRQLQSSFQPSSTVTFVSSFFAYISFVLFFLLKNVEQVADQLQSLNVASKVTMRVNKQTSFFSVQQKNKFLFLC